MITQLSAPLGGFGRLLSLPKRGEVGDERRHGYESESAVSRSWITTLTRKAEKENNELAKNADATEVP